MKTKIFSLMVLMAVLGSCKSNLDKPVGLEVIPLSRESYQEGDTLVVRKNFPVLFHLKGYADYITFWSGEPGHEYAKKDLVIVPPGSISSKLSFTLNVQYGNATINNETFKVKISGNFGELTGNNKKADSTKIKTHNWNDITNQISLSYVPNSNTEVSFPLSDDYSRELTVAFLYETTNNTVGQCRWEVRDLKIVTTDNQTGIVSSFPAANMGFIPFDMYANDNPYKVATSNVAGVWNLVKIADPAGSMMGIHGSTVGDPINNDWLISAPINLRTRVLDRGVAIKSFADGLSDYIHTFKNEGVYEVNFVGRSHNYKASSEVIKTVFIKVIK